MGKISADLASLDRERMLKYKTFAAAFSYPDENFFKFFPEAQVKKEKFQRDYDLLFRSREIWLYSTEYLANNEFERTNYLADIMGFYRAFGLEPDRERPDFLGSEFEFMHYLIFKKERALRNRLKDAAKKANICLDAQSKFFLAHLYPAAQRISQKIISQGENNFYAEIARELLSFLESENRYLNGN